MAAEHDFRTWPRREEAARQLGISVATLRRYEGELLHPIKDGNGHHRFDPQELRAVGPEIVKRRKRKAAAPRPPRDAARPAASARDAEPPRLRVSGEVTKRAFAMFVQGHSRLDVLMELGEAPENVDWLWEKYLEFSGKKAAEAARRSAGQASQPSSPAGRRKEPPALEVNYEWSLRSRPRESLDASELSDLVYLERVDARKALYEEKQRAVVAERASIAPGAVQAGAVVDVEELLARAGDSLTAAEREFVKIVEAYRDQERRMGMAQGIPPPT